MFNKKIIAAAIAVSGLFITASASAQYYAGATVGQARWNGDCSGTTSCKTTDTAFKVLGGYNIDNTNWGVEASYFNLGKVTVSDGALKGEIKGSGVDLSGVYRASFNNQWGGFAKLGIAYVKGEVEASLGSAHASQSTNSTQAVVGAGVTYAFDKNISVRAEVESRKVEVPNSSGNVTNFNIGLQFAF